VAAGISRNRIPHVVGAARIGELLGLLGFICVIGEVTIGEPGREFFGKDGLLRETRHPDSSGDAGTRRLSPGRALRAGKSAGPAAASAAGGFSPSRIAAYSRRED